MTGQAAAPWLISAEDFPRSGSRREQLAFLVGYAILAPSGHNTQPWLFRVSETQIDVYADRTRALPVVDPFDRELTISCGAAISFLELAARRFSLAATVTLLPDNSEPDLLARVAFDSGSPTTQSENQLFEAIGIRRTNRTSFAMEPVPKDFAEACTACAERQGIEIRLLETQRARSELARLVSEGDRMQFHDPRFRRELACWVHSKRLGSRDGMSGESFGLPDILAGVGRMVIRSFDIGEGVAASDEDKVLAGTPALLVFGCKETPEEWLKVGRALGEISLLATAHGLSISYLNQPIETDALRPEVRSIADLRLEPQLLLRVGRATGSVNPTARRDPAEVMLD
ncbi:MAG: nitroreductase [Pseudomonadota bacterium]